MFLSLDSRRMHAQSHAICAIGQQVQVMTPTLRPCLEILGVSTGVISRRYVHRMAT